jgi:hypothetical protein
VFEVVVEDCDNRFITIKPKSIPESVEFVKTPEEVGRKVKRYKVIEKWSFL